MARSAQLRLWKKLPRLFVQDDLAATALVTLPDTMAHYLVRVMRRAVGDAIILCNGRDGAWQCSLITITRHSVTARCETLLQAQAQEPDVRLYFAPLKRDHQDYLLQKATELGVSQLQPVITDHTAAPPPSVARSQAIIREAAEQSERLTLPVLHNPIQLANLLQQDFTHLTLFAAMESGVAMALPQALAWHPSAPAAFLIGPEGGFSVTEITALQAHKHIIPIHLGERILRADTAALSVLACWQAWCGELGSADNAAQTSTGL